MGSDFFFFFLIFNGFQSTVFLTSLRNKFFAWHFTLNENILFCFIISYQISFVFSVSVLFFFSNMYPKIEMAKSWSDLSSFYSKAIFFFSFLFLSKKIFYYFSLLNLNY